MTASFAAETPLWEPSEEVKQKANVTQYIQWLAREKETIPFRGQAEPLDEKNLFQQASRLLLFWNGLQVCTSPFSLQGQLVEIGTTLPVPHVSKNDTIRFLPADSTNLIHGGICTQEMCITFLMYFP